MTRQKDPSTKMLRSGFGDQVRSTQQSNPSFGFGTSVRESGLKVRPDEDEERIRVHLRSL